MAEETATIFWFTNIPSPAGRPKTNFYRCKSREEAIIYVNEVLEEIRRPFARILTANGLILEFPDIKAAYEEIKSAKS